ncbi:hypothetical protein GCM10011583_19390 [Streptomyces camponoticapitis]|uniref:Lipoprotein n=1 Tax=Streptomyces camponoticapitis TaxID=1616125 RepID=A0ABQ2E5C7_9ACTN|nr:hypothetical protein [Streptomyces camponoticapitis]GGJ88058.1 hypothetical protein GCM10011583_19390 [Streptomyces camponoticapitis]
MHIRQGRTATALVVLLAATLLSCSSSEDPQRGDGDTSSPPRAAAADPTTAEPAPDASTPPVELVRDAFATLQATLNDDCTPGACDYFLGRVHDELSGLDAAMKADPKGPGHFKEPLAWTSKLWKTLGDDTSTPNLEKHRTDLIGTRDKINVWMQDHPDDYS